jgi:uncharacterized protein
VVAAGLGAVPENIAVKRSPAWLAWTLLGLASGSGVAAQDTGPRVQALVAAALDQTRTSVVYDGSYRRISYPGGDVPAKVGVCTDVVVRAYRAIGIDLQQRVHEDMLRAFGAYPPTWGLLRPDSNIDHRRVPNLQAFFRRQQAERPASTDATDYRAGDVVTWRLPGALPHIGLVTDRHSADGARPLVLHNIGNGPELEDMLFRFPVTGHYRYLGD